MTSPAAANLPPAEFDTRHRAIIWLALPIIIANAATPLLGLVDTAVIGQTGSAADLGAIAFGSLIINFLFWGFGFLRMGTSGFTAQAAGAGDDAEVRAALGRALLLGATLGLGLIALQYPLSQLAFWLLDGSPAVEQGAQTYLSIRIWGAPASLASYAIMGCLIGLGHSRQLLGLQLLLNGINAGLDLLFVLGFGWGIAGIALGTVMAEWICLLVGMLVLFRLLRKNQPPEPLVNWARLLNPQALLRTLKVNGDILWRTLFMLSGFGWFANQGAQFGDITLAANHILLQFISFAAFFLDGFAFALESLVGRAIGARNRPLFDRVIRVSSRIAASCALGLALMLVALGPQLIDWLTPVATIQHQAKIYLPYAAGYILLSFMAFQLDGLFIGATQGRALRNAAGLSLLVFLGCAWPLSNWLGNQGLWLAFMVYVLARALSLGYYLPSLKRELLGAQPKPATPS